MGPDASFARRTDPDQFAALESGTRKDRLAAVAAEDIVERRFHVTAHAPGVPDVPPELFRKADVLVSQAIDPGKRAEYILTFNEGRVLAGNRFGEGLVVA